MTYLSVNSAHSHLAAASSEFTIKVVSLGKPEGEGGREATLTGHIAPVLCVRFDPKGDFLVSGDASLV